MKKVLGYVLIVLGILFCLSCFGRITFFTDHLTIALNSALNMDERAFGFGSILGWLFVLFIGVVLVKYGNSMRKMKSSSL